MAFNGGKYNGNMANQGQAFDHNKYILNTHKQDTKECT